MRRVVFLFDDPVIDQKHVDELSLEVYKVARADKEDQIENALLNDLCTPLILVFVGSEEIKPLSDSYHGMWCRTWQEAISLLGAP